MSLAKIPFIFLFGWGLQVTLTEPNPEPLAPKKIERKIADGPIALLMTWFFTKSAYWVHAVIELVVILAAAGPKSKVAESVLTVLLPHKDPSRIFVSPMVILATVLMMMGTIIRLQCYRELGKHFTFKITILENHKLITSGPYSYVRHPAYTGGFISFAGTALWYTAQGSWLRESEVTVYKKPLRWIVMVPLMANLCVLTLALFRRIPTEDKMLKTVFGKEWDEWARKVPTRLLPGIY